MALTCSVQEYSQKVKELRRALEELRSEKEMSDAMAARAAALKEEVSELRQANRSLEDKIARLCEAPFISDAFGQHDAALKYEDLLRERDELRAKADHLQEAVRTHFSALTSLKQQAAQFREDKEASEKQMEDLRYQLKDVKSGSDMLQDQLRLYSGDDGVDIESLERALTLVKRRGQASQKLPFLEDADHDSMISIPGLKRKLEELQVLNLSLTEENERLDNMLKLQAGINKDLHKELEMLVRSRDKESREKQQKATEFEEVALKRLDKIHVLEAQVRQFVYGLAKNGKGDRGGRKADKPFNSAMLDTSFGSDDADNALLSELVADKGEELRPDENLLEIWVKGATIRDNGILAPGSSTFVVIDFFDYESQTTSLLSGPKPQWDFASTYKIAVDDFLLRYLALDVVSLELNMVSAARLIALISC